jgi:COP9 signalosome complex subunit 4
MESRLVQFAALSQKDKGPAYLSLLSEILSRTNLPSIASDLHILIDTVVNQDNVGLVVGRQVLAELVRLLGEGAVQNAELRKHIVEDTLTTIQPRIVSYEEQVSSCKESNDSGGLTLGHRSTHYASSSLTFLNKKKNGVTLPGY